MLFAVLLVGVFASLVVQEFLPPLGWLHGTRVLLYPVIMFYGAFALSFPWMLALVFASGLMWDLSTAMAGGGQIQPTPGWSIALFALLCVIAHGLRPLFLKGRWEIYCLITGLGTALIVAAEFIMISVSREGLLFNATVWWRIAGSGLIALFLAPLFYWFSYFAGIITGRAEVDQRGGSLTFDTDGIFKH